MDSEGYLANSRLFRGVDDEQLASLCKIAQMEMFDAGAYIFSEGDIGESLFVVLDGSVRISITTPSQTEEALVILKAGDSFGEMAVVYPEQRERSANAIAHEDCCVLRIGRAALNVLLEGDHTLGFIVMRNVVRYLSEEMRRSNQKILFMAAAGMF